MPFNFPLHFNEQTDNINIRLNDSITFFSVEDKKIDKSNGALSDCFLIS